MARLNGNRIAPGRGWQPIRSVPDVAGPVLAPGEGPRVLETTSRFRRFELRDLEHAHRSGEQIPVGREGIGVCAEFDALLGVMAGG
ncbi:MAG: hypothetical protein VCC04_03610, partial [Myxococcota bacterium]